MSAQILDGKKVSTELRERLKIRAAELIKAGTTPGLAVILVGNDPASQRYVKSKGVACQELGLYSRQYDLPADTTQEQLLELIVQLNGDAAIHGILVQLPLPKHLDEKSVLEAIAPQKDVDAFHAQNVGKIMIGNATLLPCTPAGVMEILKAYDIDPSGKECVVLGRSNIVGKPMGMLLLHANGTVTICHSRTANLPQVCRRADILVAAVGIAKFVKADMVKAGAVVIDVGMDRDENGKLCGDVDFEAVKEVAAYITPVPGGVGPMTITMLMANTIEAAAAQSHT